MSDFKAIWAKGFHEMSVQELIRARDEFYKRYEEKPMTKYFTKDGLKIEVGMEVQTEYPLHGKVVYISEKKCESGENIVIEIENNELTVCEPSELTSVKKYNGYGLFLDENGMVLTNVQKNEKCNENFLNIREAFTKLISHHGCRPFVDGVDNFVMFYHHEVKQVCWAEYTHAQETPLTYEKPYPELEETFKQFLGV